MTNLRGILFISSAKGMNSRILWYLKIYFLGSSWGMWVLHDGYMEWVITIIHVLSVFSFRDEGDFYMTTSFQTHVHDLHTTICIEKVFLQDVLFILKYSFLEILQKCRPCNTVSPAANVLEGYIYIVHCMVIKYTFTSLRARIVKTDSYHDTVL